MGVNKTKMKRKKIIKRIIIMLILNLYIVYTDKYIHEMINVDQTPSF